MNYPFLYQILGHLDSVKIRNNLILTEQKITVWDDWKLIGAKSEQVEEFIKQNLNHLKIFNDQIYVSDGTTSNFHIDRYRIYHLLHRILIPLDDNFHYEWVIGDKKLTYQPKKGEVILFNNMQPHRFVSDDSSKREVIYFDLYDPLVADLLLEVKGNYSSVNAELDKKYSRNAN